MHQMIQAAEASAAYAKKLDEQDALRSFRSRFHFPGAGENEAIYFCGNSLGLQPKNAAAAIEQELADWRKLAALAVIFMHSIPGCITSTIFASRFHGLPAASHLK